MKLVINDCFGGFEIPEEICLKKDIMPNDEMDRSDPDLVAFVEAHGGVYRAESWSLLRVVDIPDTATDWILVDNDGLEYVLYAVDGRIHSSQWEECE